MTDVSRLRPTVVCFLDLLGTTKLIAEAARANDEFGFVARFVHALLPLHRSLETGLEGSAYHWHAFSDTIVLSLSADEPNVDFRIRTLCRDVAEIQSSLAREGFFARGAVAFGPYFAEERIGIGSGLLAAIELEKTDAMVPRIIVDSTIRSRLLARGGANPTTTLPNDDFFAIDEDGQVFINYLRHRQSTEQEAVLVAHRDTLHAQLLEHSEVGAVRAKYIWLAAYHNWFCHAWQSARADLALDGISVHSFRRLAAEHSAAVA